MGRGIGCGVDIDNEHSPCCAAIEKTQAELRQEFLVREERRRELDFLEKGGNPLDFKIGSLYSSQAEPLEEHNLASDGKGSFALNASSNRESAESNERPDTRLGKDPNTADNFAGNPNILGNHRITLSSEDKGPVSQEGQCYKLDGNQAETHKSEDSGGVHMGVKGYARRNRHRSNRSCGSSVRNVVKLLSNDMSQTLSTSVKDFGQAKDSNIEIQTDKTVDCTSEIASRPSVLHEKGVPGHSLSKGNEVMGLAKVQPQDSDLNILSKPSEESNVVVKACSVSENAQGELHVREVDVNESIRSKNNSESEGFAEECLQNSCKVSERVEKALPMHEQINVAFESKTKDENYLKIEEGSHNGYSMAATKLNGVNALEKNLDNPCDVLEQHFSRENSVCEKTSEESNILTAQEALTSDQSDFVVNARVNPATEIKTLMDSYLKVKSEEVSHVSIASALQKESPQISVFQDDYEIPSAVHVKDKIPPTSQLHDVSGVRVEAGNHKRCLSPATKMAQSNVRIEKHKHINALHLKHIEKLEKMPRLSKTQMSHWDYVLEEVKWMANDFMQERLWKISLAAQLSHWVAHKRNGTQFWSNDVEGEKRKVAHKLASFIMKYWHDADRLPCCECVQEKSQGMGDIGNKSCKNSPLQHYAIHSLMRIPSIPVQAETPLTPDRLLDTDVLSPSCVDHLTKKSFFYTPPYGAMEAYRISVESDRAFHNHGKMKWDENTTAWTSQEEHRAIEGSDEASELFKYTLSDYADDTHSHSGFSPPEKTFFGDEHETKLDYLSGTFDRSNFAKAHKRRKSIMKASLLKTYAGKHQGESYYSSLGNKRELRSIFSPSSTVNGKRVLPSRNLNIGTIPTKRIRSSTVNSRQRAAVTYSGGTAGGSSLANKADASSGDTSSLQEDVNTVSGGSHPLKITDMDSSVTCGKRWDIDGNEMYVKNKKKKKAKHLHTASSFSMDTTENREPTKRMINCQPYSATHLSGPALDLQIANLQGKMVLPAAKKQKLSKQISEMSPDIGTPGSVSATSPIAYQHSNMSNTNKLMKVIANRDRGRKNKIIGKVMSSQAGTGMPWSTFEDQALVVLVHDFGPNWDLVSDMINSSLQIKSIFRKPKDCQQRHKGLMERTGGDGGESPEDSGSSQHYQSTLPGVPKGNARMLLQRVQGPMEEETLRMHFEKIVQASRRHCARKFQNHNHEQKRSQVHLSHLQALSHLPGGLLTPLDLCDHTSQQTEVSHQFPTSHGNALGMANPLGTVSAVQTVSCVVPSIQGTTNLPLSGSYATSSVTMNCVTASRDVQQRLASMRPMSVNMDEQQHLQQYNQMLSARNFQSPAIISGMNRGIPLSRPGIQGLGSPSILSAPPSAHSNMLPSSGIGLPASSPMTSGPIQGGLMPRSRDNIQMLRSSHGNGQVGTAFSNQTSSFSNQMASSSSPSFPSPHHHQIPQAQNSLQHSHLQGSSHNHQRQSYLIHHQMRQPFLHSQFSQNGSPVTQTQIFQHQHTSLPQPSKSVSPTNLQRQNSASALATSMLQSSQKRQLNQSQTLGQNLLGSHQSTQTHKQLQQRQQQQKHQPQQQQKHQAPIQEQKSKSSKGLEGGSKVLQNLPTESGQTIMPQNSPTCQHADKGEQNAHSGHLQRVFTESTCHPSGKQLIKPGISEHQGQSLPQLAVNLAKSMPLSHQQKGHLQYSMGKQQHLSLAKESHPSSTSYATSSQPPEQLPISQNQVLSIPPPIISSSQKQRQMLQSPQPVQQKITLRQMRPDVGLQAPPQLNKGCIKQEDQVSVQMASQQWKDMQDIPQSSVCCNSSNQTTVSTPILSSAAESSGMPMSSLNENTNLQVPNPSAVVSSATSMTGSIQRKSMGQVSSSTAQNVAVNVGVGSMPSQQMAIQLQSQQQSESSPSQQQLEGPKGIQNSHGLGSFEDSPTSAPIE